MFYPENNYANYWKTLEGSYFNQQVVDMLLLIIRIDYDKRIIHR